MQEINNEVFDDYDLKSMYITIPFTTLNDLVGEPLVKKFIDTVQDGIDKRGSVDGINSEVDFGIVGTITEHVVYADKKFKSFGAGIAAVKIAKIAIEIMQAAKAKGIELKIGYSSFMPNNEPYKFEWVLAHPEKMLKVRFTDYGKEVHKRFKAAGIQYPGYGLDIATIVQPSED